MQIRRHPPRPSLSLSLEADQWNSNSNSVAIVGPSSSRPALACPLAVNCQLIRPRPQPVGRPQACGASPASSFRATVRSPAAARREQQVAVGCKFPAPPLAPLASGSHKPNPLAAFQLRARAAHPAEPERRRVGDRNKWPRRPALAERIICLLLFTAQSAPVMYGRRHAPGGTSGRGVVQEPVEHVGRLHSSPQFDPLRPRPAGRGHSPRSRSSSRPAKGSNSFEAKKKLLGRPLVAPSRALAFKLFLSPPPVVLWSLRKSS